MIAGKENVFAWMREMEAPYWTLYRDKKGEKIAESSDAPGLGLDASIMRLENIFSWQSAGRFFLVIKTSNEATKAGLYQDYVELTGNGARSSQTAQMGCGPDCGCGKGVASIGATGAMTADMVQQAIAKAKAEWDKDHEIKELKLKITELQAEGRMGQVAKALEPIIYRGIGMLANKMSQPTQLAVAGWHDDTEETAMQTDMNETEYTTKLQEQLERLDAVLEPENYDLLEVVTALANKAETDKGTILMALNMLGVSKK